MSIEASKEPSSVFLLSIPIAGILNKSETIVSKESSNNLSKYDFIDNLLSDLFTTGTNGFQSDNIITSEKIKRLRPWKVIKKGNALFRGVNPSELLYISPKKFLTIPGAYPRKNFPKNHLSYSCE